MQYISRTDRGDAKVCSLNGSRSATDDDDAIEKRVG